MDKDYEIVKRICDRCDKVHSTRVPKGEDPKTRVFCCRRAMRFLSRVSWDEFWATEAATGRLPE